MRKLDHTQSKPADRTLDEPTEPGNERKAEKA
jgi:hypothetical protein